MVELTDEEWGLVEHLFDPPVHRGVKGTIPRRDIVDAILWVARTGCQWRRWRDKGVWAAVMRALAREIRLRHKRKPDPTMVMIDAQTVKGGRAGPTFHEAGGRGGYTRGATRTILIETLGLAVAVKSAKPHDVQSARAFLKDQLDPKNSALPGLQAIVAERGYTGLLALASNRGLNLDIKKPPTPSPLPPSKPDGKPSLGRPSASSRRSARSTRLRTPSPGWACGGGCRAATSRPRSVRRLGSRSPARPTSTGGSGSSRPDQPRAATASE